jgi:hypothetical protein
MSEMIDLEKHYREEQKRWMREEAPRRTFRDVLTGSVPYWIVLVALVLYGLSAPHTAGVFDNLTPGWGFIAPVGVEFGLLYAAFRRRLAKSENEDLPWTLWALEILLFLTAMLVNGAGAFTSVVSAMNLEALSSSIVEEFGVLPATPQAALVMALLSAFIIPIGALVAGDGQAALALERRTTSDAKEQAWQEVEFTVIYPPCTDGICNRAFPRWRHGKKRLVRCADTWGKVQCPLSANCPLRPDRANKTDTLDKRTDRAARSKPASTPTWTPTQTSRICPSIRYLPRSKTPESRPDAPPSLTCCKSARRLK